MGKKYEELRGSIIDLWREGLSRGEISRQLGLNDAVVTKVCQEEKLVFDRTTSVSKTKGRLEQAAEQRSRIMHRMMNASEAMLDLLDQPMIVFNFGGRDNTYAEQEVSSPPIADKLRLMQAAGIGVDKALDLAAHDAGSARVSINLILATAEKLGLDTSDGE